MKKPYVFFIALTILTVPLVASAHTSVIEHGGLNAMLHIFTHFDHLLTIGVVIAAIIISQAIQHRTLKLVSMLTAVAGTLLLILQ